jgi:hypothetical protein
VSCDAEMSCRRSPHKSPSCIETRGAVSDMKLATEQPGSERTMTPPPPPSLRSHCIYMVMKKRKKQVGGPRIQFSEIGYIDDWRTDMAVKGNATASSLIFMHS